MAYDEGLAERIRSNLAGRSDVTELKMFGGIAFMVADHMALGVNGDDLMVRVAPDAHDDALARPHVRPMDFTGRPIRGWVYVGPAGTARDADLVGWVEAGAAFAALQPNKASRRASGR